MNKFTEVTSSNRESIQQYLKKIFIPLKNSRKGNNGRILVIGGSELFHTAPLWAAQIASRFVDIVHLASTQENNQVFKKIKAKFNHGIVVRRDDLESYITEDDVVLIGPGMMREYNEKTFSEQNKTLKEILSIKNEGSLTKELVKYLIFNFKNKQFVFDAGALQMMDPDWLRLLEKPAILTPHFKEFETLFGIDLSILTFDDQINTVRQMAIKYNCIILCKSYKDIISSWDEATIVTGGNQGLTKGGTGDVLAGLVGGLSAKSDAFSSAVLGSYLVKTSADQLFKTRGLWFNCEDLISQIPLSMTELVYNIESVS
jgi:NAD(P)H-hydrate epimerase